MNSVSKTVTNAVTDIKAGNNNIVLSTGVVLRPVRIPAMIFPEVTRKFRRPEPPRVYSEDLGREIENPDHPDYQSRLQQYESDISVAIVDTMIIMGTELVSVPKGMDVPGDSGWAKKLRAIGLDVGNEAQRYLMWVKYQAAPTEQDIAKIMEEVGRLSGVSESDVSQAVEQFRDNA